MAVQGLLEFWPCKNVNKLISGCLFEILGLATATRTIRELVYVESIPYGYVK